MFRKTMRLVIGSAIATVFVAGLVALSAPTHAAFGGGHCICPDVYAPVTCSNGVTYPNACRASCAHATDCVPSGNI
jgi:hypothetical protein